MAVRGDQPMVYLASKSNTREQLMGLLDIPFALMEQDADESRCPTDVSLQELVSAIARLKMDNLNRLHMPDSGSWYVITADTLCQAPDGSFLGKPTDREQALHMLEIQSGQWVDVATSVCARYYEVLSPDHLHIRTEQTCVTSRVCLDIPASMRAQYLEMTHALQAAGAMVIDGKGASYVREVKGSYTNILGLPLYETKQLLLQLGYVI